MKDWKQSVERVIQLLPDDLRIKGERMAEAYAYMYVLENELRLFIDKTLKEKIGEDFFDKIASKDLKKAYDNRKTEEAKHQWMGVRGNSPLFYIDFDDLATLIISQWETFKSYFPMQSWITVKLNELSKCRNLIAHNSHIGEDERQLIKLYFEQIIRQINIRIPDQQNELPWKNTEEEFCFIKGLKHSKVLTVQEAEKGGEHLLEYPAWLEVKPWAVRYFFMQIAVCFTVRFPNAEVYLPTEFSLGIEPKTDDWRRNVKVQIGQFDIDNDGIDEIFIGIMEDKHDMGIEINVFKYYPPAMPEHAGRYINWSLMGVLKAELLMGEYAAVVKRTINYNPKKF
jgi:hypothetical protein